MSRSAFAIVNKRAGLAWAAATIANGARRNAATIANVARRNAATIAKVLTSRAVRLTESCPDLVDLVHTVR